MYTCVPYHICKVMRDHVPICKHSHLLKAGATACTAPVYRTTASHLLVTIQCWVQRAKSVSKEPCLLGLLILNKKVLAARCSIWHTTRLSSVLYIISEHRSRFKVLQTSSFAFAMEVARGSGLAQESGKMCVPSRSFIGTRSALAHFCRAVTGSFTHIHVTHHLMLS